MVRATVSGHRYELDSKQVEEAAQGIVAEPIREHYVVVDSRRIPPKQLLAAITGLDRADFTTHQARSVFQRLGFGVYRRGQTTAAPAQSNKSNGITSYDPWYDKSNWPHKGEEGHILNGYKGRWVAQDGIEVIFDADSPQAVVAWLRQNNKRGTVWKVPSSRAEASGTTYTDLS